MNLSKPYLFTTPLIMGGLLAALTVFLFPIAIPARVYSETEAKTDNPGMISKTYGMKDTEVVTLGLAFDRQRNGSSLYLFKLSPRLGLHETLQARLKFTPAPPGLGQDGASASRPALFATVDAEPSFAWRYWLLIDLLPSAIIGSALVWRQRKRARSKALAAVR